jgi:hypothetical protein
VQLANRNFAIPEGATALGLIVETRDSMTAFFLDEAVGAVAGTAIGVRRVVLESVVEALDCGCGVEAVWRVTRVYIGEVRIYERRAAKRSSDGALLPQECS